MNTMFGNVAQVGPRTAKTFEDLKSGFQFRVVGDGKVEAEIVDRFGSSALVQSFDDPRLKAFATRQLALAAEGLNEGETRKALQCDLNELLGEQWQISNYLSRAGQGVARVDLRYAMAGAGEQEVYLDNRDLAFHLNTTVEKSGWTVVHRIEGRQDSANWTESATFEQPAESTTANPAGDEYAEYSRLLDLERAKPGWEDSQARQAWLHWG